MSYYTDLRSRDIVDWLKPVIDSREYICRRGDGKFKLCEISEPTHSPWHHIDFAHGAICPYLQKLFNTISVRTPAGQFIPRRCQSCWKIVIRPQTLKQLFALEDILERLMWPSKCGIERRSYTPTKYGRYGGYVYNMSTAEGLDRIDILRGLVDKEPFLGPDVEMYLKRACTEMEMAFPDSTTWTVSEAQKRVEDLLDWYIVFDVPSTHTATHLIDKVHMTWIEWACENGDDTYLEYTDGKPIYRPAVRYERKADGTNEETPKGKTVSAGWSSPSVPKGGARRTTKKKVKK